MARRAFLPPLFVTLALAARASAALDAVGTTAAAFLKLGSGARSEAMGRAYVSLADDVGGMAYNPAGLGGMEERYQLEFSGSTWVDQLYFFHFGLAAPPQAWLRSGRWGLSISSIGVPSIPRTIQIADTGDPTLNYYNDGSFSASNWALGPTLAWSWRDLPLAGDLDLGAGLKYIQQNIDSSGGKGLAFDLGLRKRLKGGPTFGFAVQNLGPDLVLGSQAAPLPLVARLGGHYCISQESISRWLKMPMHMTLSAEVDLPNDYSEAFAAGLELGTLDKPGDTLRRFVARAGLRYDQISNPVTAGLGIIFRNFEADLSFAFAFKNPAIFIPKDRNLGFSGRASLSYYFGGPGVEEVSPRPTQPRLSLHLLQGQNTLRLGSGQAVRLSATAEGLAQASLYLLGVRSTESVGSWIWVRNLSAEQLAAFDWGGLDLKRGSLPAGSYEAGIFAYANSELLARSPALKLEVVRPGPAEPRLSLHILQDTVRQGGLVQTARLSATAEGLPNAAYFWLYVRNQAVSPEAKAVKGFMLQNLGAFEWDGTDLNKQSLGAGVYEANLRALDSANKDLVVSQPGVQLKIVAAGPTQNQESGSLKVFSQTSPCANGICSNAFPLKFYVPAQQGLGTGLSELRIEMFSDQQWFIFKTLPTQFMSPQGLSWDWDGGSNGGYNYRQYDSKTLFRGKLIVSSAEGETPGTPIYSDPFRIAP